MIGSIHLKQHLNLEPEHLSLYSLIVEEGTPLGKEDCERDGFHEPDDDIVADQYEWSLRVIWRQAGYAPL